MPAGQFRFVESARFDITGHDETGDVTANEVHACMAQLADFMKAYKKTTRITHKIRRNLGLSDAECITYVTAWSRLWFFDKFFTDPVEIVKRDEFTWDLTTVTGLEMYAGVCVLRSMQEYPAFVSSHAKLDLNLKKDQLGKKVITLLYPKLGIYRNYNSTVGNGHHFFAPIGDLGGLSAEERVGSYKFDGLIEVPVQKPLVECPYWNQTNRQSGKFECDAQFVPENTK